MLWHRLRRPPAAPPADQAPEPDPDLDRIRREQHALLNRVTSETLRASLRAKRIETIEESWRRDHARP